MKYTVTFSEAAALDLEQLFDFALQRELDSETGDLDIPDRAIQAIKAGVAFLETAPFNCRKAGSSSFIRELIIRNRLDPLRNLWDFPVSYSTEPYGETIQHP